MMLWKPWPIEMDDKNDDLPNFNIVILQMLTSADPPFGRLKMWGNTGFDDLFVMVFFGNYCGFLKNVYFWHKPVLVAIWGWSGGKRTICHNL